MMRAHPTWFGLNAEVFENVGPWKRVQEVTLEEYTAGRAAIKQVVSSTQPHPLHWQY